MSRNVNPFALGQRVLILTNKGGFAIMIAGKNDFIGYYGNMRFSIITEARL